VRARVRWHEQGEKSTKYFLNLEKRNHIKKHIRTLHISGVTKTDPSCILKEIDQIYCDLYKTNNNLTDIEFKIDSFLNDLNIPTLSEEQSIIWNNKQIRIDKRPVFYKNYIEAGVICIQDLLFDLNINEAFSHWSDKIANIRYLQWAGLRTRYRPF